MEEIQQIRLSNLLGETLMDRKAINKSHIKIDVSKYQTGIYFIFVKTQTNNLFNYGFSFLAGENFKRNKISFGIIYSTYNYYYTVNPSADNPLTKREYRTKYLNLPFEYSYRFHLKKRNGISLLTGIIFYKSIESVITSNYIDKPALTETLNKNEKKQMIDITTWRQSSGPACPSDPSTDGG